MNLQQYKKRLEDLTVEMASLDTKVGPKFSNFNRTDQLNFKFDRLDNKVSLNDTYGRIFTYSMNNNNLSEENIKAIHTVIEAILKFIAKYNEIANRKIIT